MNPAELKDGFKHFPKFLRMHAGTEYKVYARSELSEKFVELTGSGRHRFYYVNADKFDVKVVPEIIQSNYKWSEKVRMLIQTGTSIYGEELKAHLRKCGVTEYDKKGRIGEIEHREGVFISPEYLPEVKAKFMKNMKTGRSAKEEEKWIDFKEKLGDKQDEAFNSFKKKTRNHDRIRKERERKRRQVAIEEAGGENFVIDFP